MAYKAVLFDLFYTLIDPKRRPEETEWDAMGITEAQWDRYSEDDAVYARRATGRVTDLRQMFDEIAACGGLTLTSAQQDALIARRSAWIGRGLRELPESVMPMLQALRAKGVKVALVSNADAMDTLAWEDSPLKEGFDAVLFSWQEGIMKPDPAIYHRAAARLGVAPEECIFVGDGGSNELPGARAAGMFALFCDLVHPKSPARRQARIAEADGALTGWEDLLRYFA